MFTPTKEQSAVINHEKGHALVCAVPGSGKTATLVGRVQYLLDAGVPSSQILVLMYNKAATEEFKSRLADSIDYAKTPNIFTFHSLGYQAIEQLIKQGHLSKREIAASWQITNMISNAIKQFMANKSKQFRKMFASNEVITRKVNHQLETGNTFRTDQINEIDELIHLVKTNPVRLNDWFAANIAKMVKASLHEKGLITYRHMLTEPVRMAVEGKVAPILSGYNFILVDEYQDINQDQISLLRLVIKHQGEVMAVGDMDQCIYEWRGAMPDFMLDENFSTDFPNYKRFSLTHTFRFGENLCQAANQLIEKNNHRLPLRSKSYGGIDQTDIEIVKGRKELISILNRWTNQDQINNSVILYRYWADTLPFQLASAGLGVPFRVSSDNRNLFKQRSVTALLAWLSLPTLENININTLLSLYSFPNLRVKKEELTNLLKQLLQGKQLGQLNSSLDQTRIELVKKRWELINTWQSLNQTADAYTHIRQLQSVLNWEEALALEGETEDTAATIQEMNRVFLDTVERRKHTIGKFYNELFTLVNGGDINQEGILLSTIHGAKGLEWDNVIIDGLESGHFPRNEQIKAIDEEERRLFYVAMTRAKKNLVLVLPDAAEASIFLTEAGLLSDS